MSDETKTEPIPPAEWMKDHHVTERILEVARAWVHGAGNMHPDTVAELSLAANIGSLVAEERAELIRTFQEWRESGNGNGMREVIEHIRSRP